MTAMLIVITGTVASGKSSIARRLADEFGDHGLAAAVIDVDLVYEMVGQPGLRKDNPSTWARVRRVSAALADAFAGEGLDVVIVDGDFLTPEKRADFLDARGDGSPGPLFVTLRVSLEHALERVNEDPTRTFSRDRPFLRRHYQNAARDGLRGDLVLDTAETTPTEAARLIVEWAMPRVHREERRF